MNEEIKKLKLKISQKTAELSERAQALQAYQRYAEAFENLVEMERELEDMEKAVYPSRKVAAKPIQKTMPETKTHINAMVEHTEQKVEVVEGKPLLEVIECSCGNKIRNFNDKKNVKCFTCDKFLEKKDGKWIESKILKDSTMTFEDVMRQQGIVMRTRGK